MRSVRGMFFRSAYLFSNKPNYFKLFDLPFDFTEQQLKNSYLELVKKYHPDLTKDPAAAEVFKQIQAGYEVLSDQTKRREHQK
jgi:DnaJ-class molecular chaperone